MRQTEQLVEQLKGGGKVRSRTLTATGKSTDVLAIEERLQQKFGTRVNVHHGKKKRWIEIEYYGNDDLARLLDILGIDSPAYPDRLERVRHSSGAQSRMGD